MSSSDAYDNKTLTRLVRMLSSEVATLRRRLDALDQVTPPRRTRRRGPATHEPVKDVFVTQPD